MVAAPESLHIHPSSFNFLINPLAGKGKYQQVIHIIRQNLSGFNIKYEINVMENKAQTVHIARKAAENFDAVVAVGGDGTVNEVFNGIIGTKAVFGILPTGTGNGFAKSLGLPSSINEACQILIHGQVKTIDIGIINNRYFIGTAGIGFDAMIASYAGKKLGPLRGMWLYFYAGAINFFKYSPPLTNLNIDSENIQIRPLLVVVANTKRYGGGALIAPNALPDDGLFDVCVIKEMGAIELIWNLPKLFTGKHIKLSKVSIYRAKSVVIETDSPTYAHADGEAIGNYSKMEFQLLPRAIKVLVPKL